MASDNKGSYPKGLTNNKPVQRSSKKPRKPVTIDLEPAKVASSSAQKSGEKPSSASAMPSVKLSASKLKSASPVTSENKAGTTKSIDKNAPRQTDQANKVQSSLTQKEGLNDKTSSSGNGGEGRGNRYIFAGILGGIIALAGAFLLQQVGIISTGNTDNTELSTKIAQIDNDLKDIVVKLDNSVQPDVKLLIDRITKLETLQSAITNELSSQIKAVEKSSAKLSSSIVAAVAKSESLQQSISSGAAGENAALSALDERLKSVEASAANPTNSSYAELETLKMQLGKLADKVAGIPVDDNSQATEAVKEIAARIADLSVKMANIANSASDGQASTNEKISSVDNLLGELQNGLAGLGSRLEAVETIVETPQKDEQRVARALAVAGLKSAIDSGGGFESALALVESLGSDTNATTSLKPFAVVGVPTISSLEGTFSDLSNKIVRAGTPEKNEDVMDKLFSNLRSLVTIKSTGVIEGNNPQAIVSRIKHGLKNSDLEAVITEWGSLPDAAKSVSGDWHKKVLARHSANSLIDNLLKQFMTGASGAGN